MINLTIIGIGKLGICLGLNLEKNGFNVLGVDLDENYINSINNKTFISNEPEVMDLLFKSKNFKATTSIKDGIEHSDLIFLVVSTPSDSNGKYNHSQIEKVVEKIIEHGYQENNKKLVVCCTTFPGYCEKLNKILNNFNYNVLYNPEFIAQGEIVRGQTNPDLILIGEDDKEAGDFLVEVQLKICENKPKICRMSLTEAEIAKLSINCFLTTKISFANMIGDLCNKLNVSHTSVLNAIGCDSRIGDKYLKWGYGFGGPCLPRDNRALGVLCVENNIIPSIPMASDEYNELHSEYQIDFMIKNNDGNSITINGVSFKKNSTLIEESQPLKIANKLVDLGYDITIVDCEDVILQIKKIYGSKFKYCITNS